ncbi:MAG: BON domain-containing protein [Gammaproteobacteria bacterium]|nr:BON domain-containing protein [Gammaproteobacteria bacterium]MDH5630383.1 BON domain-containing protein [Gammaproteobacteria bacterium]
MNNNTGINLIKAFLSSVFIIFTLTSCSALVISGAATGVDSSQDRRTLSTQIQDEKNELSAIKSLLSEEHIRSNSNISVVSFNNIILIIGQANTEELKQEISDKLREIVKVGRIFNQIRVAEPTGFSDRRYDDYLTTKIKSSMLFASDLPSSKIKVVTENSEVFLMGMVTRTEAKLATDIARKTAGVTKVITLFEYIADDDQKDKKE